MAKMKQTKKYYFSVEGETEQWYLYYLRDLINKEESSAYKVTIDCSIQKDPLKRAKTMVITGKTEIYHIADYESNDDIHMRQFLTMLDRMKEAQKIGKQIKYSLGYSNFTFELWIILHKGNCNTRLSDRKQYLRLINHAYNEKFQSLSEYKEEDNFKRILNEISIENVKSAVAKAKQIMRQNEVDYLQKVEYKGYKYYRGNPSLSVWEAIEKILNDCSL